MVAAARGIAPKSIGSLNWTQLSGSASRLAVAPDGSLWALSTLPAGANKYLWHYTGGTWTNVPGLAADIAVGPDGTLYAVNSSSGGVYAYNGSTWSALGGGADWVTTGADGSVYVLSNGNIVGGNSAIWKYSGGVWTQQPGEGAQLAGSFDLNTYAVPGVGTVAPDGFFVVNSTGSIYYYSPGTGYGQFPGAAANVAPTLGGMFVLGYPASANGEEAFYFDYTSGGWTAEPGSGISLAAGRGAGGTGAQLYTINSANAIWTTAVASSNALVGSSFGPCTLGAENDNFLCQDLTYAGNAVYYFTNSFSVFGSDTSPAAPTLSGNFFFTNPGSFPVTGTVLEASQSIVSNLPSHLSGITNIALENDFGSETPFGQTSIITPGESFTCSLFDNGALIGSATSTVGGTAPVSATVQCNVFYPPATPTPGIATISLPTNTFNPGDAYTFIVSH